MAGFSIRRKANGARYTASETGRAKAFHEKRFVLASRYLP